MQKKLSIIIPFEDQKESALVESLTSINNQGGLVRFEELDVHLVNDSGKSIAAEKFAIFGRLDLHYHEPKKKLGFGMACQYGVTRSEGEYFLFLEPGDLINTVYGLHYFFQVQEAHALYISSHVEIVSNEMGVKFIPRQADVNNLVLYGKIFRRSFVKSLNLKFREEVRGFEDFYYTQVVLNVTKDVVLLNDRYIYCHRMKSSQQVQQVRQSKRRKKISIIIPIYGQTEADLAIPLGSVNCQIGVDFSQFDIHIVNDGGKVIDPSKFALFEHLDIHYHELKKNMGPGLARQYGIDHSDSDYIMFIDSDDMLDGFHPLLMLFDALSKQGNHDLFVTSFIETADNLGFNPVKADASLSYLYNKLYRRSYIEALKLKFPEELSYNYEDTYYSNVVATFSQDIILLGDCWLYCRRTHQDSLSNSMASNKSTNLRVIYKRLIMEKFKELEKPGLDTELESTIVENYLWAKLYPAYDQAVFEQEIAKTLREFSDFWITDKVSLQEQLSRQTKIYSGFKNIKDTGDFDEFIDRIEKLAATME